MKPAAGRRVTRIELLRAEATIPLKVKDEIVEFTFQDFDTSWPRCTQRKYTGGLSMLPIVCSVFIQTAPPPDADVSEGVPGQSP